MKLHSTLCGIYPKLIEDPQTPHLKRSLHAFDRQELLSDRLEEVIQLNTRASLDEQKEAGITRLSDPLIRWESFYSPFIAAWGGLKRGDLKRIYDTNTLQRRPHVTGPIVYRETTVVTDAVLASQYAGGSIKATLPGPFTFAVDCEDTYYQDHARLTEDLATALNRTLREYQAKGITYVELYDPELHFTQFKVDFITQIYSELLAGIDRTKVMLGGFYGTPLKENLVAALKTGLAGITLDLITNPDSDSWIGSAAPSILQLGVLDARTTADDDLAVAAKQIAAIRGRFPAAEIWLSLNNSTEFLPRDRAVKKFSRLRELL